MGANSVEAVAPRPTIRDNWKVAALSISFSLRSDAGENIGEEKGVSRKILYIYCHAVREVCI